MTKDVALKLSSYLDLLLICLIVSEKKCKAQKVKWLVSVPVLVQKIPLKGQEVCRKMGTKEKNNIPMFYFTKKENWQEQLKKASFYNCRAEPRDSNYKKNSYN